MFIYTFMFNGDVRVGYAVVVSSTPEEGKAAAAAAIRKTLVDDYKEDGADAAELETSETIARESIESLDLISTEPFTEGCVFLDMGLDG